MGDKADFDSWAVVELLGHVRMAGRVTEEERYGSRVGRLDVPADGDTFTTVLFTAGSLYRMTFCSEEAARAAARGTQPRPVHRYELPGPGGEPAHAGFDGDEDDDDDLFDR